MWQDMQADFCQIHATSLRGPIKPRHVRDGFVFLKSLSYFSSLIPLKVENKFKNAWGFPNLRKPTIKRIFKIIENKSFLQPYDRYKSVLTKYPGLALTTDCFIHIRRKVHNELFRYHGTTRNCNLGSRGNTRICGSTSCPLCSILKTSFKTSLANPTGA